MDKNSENQPAQLPPSYRGMSWPEWFARYFDLAIFALIIVLATIFSEQIAKWDDGFEKTAVLILSFYIFWFALMRKWDFRKNRKAMKMMTLGLVALLIIGIVVFLLTK